jgi:hypothetical protein
MPQGKGTYGSQVGNPSFKKGKKKYQTGGNVDPFSNRNPEGVVVDKTMEALDMQNEMQEGIPMANAMDRKQVMPDTEQYNDGGPVKKDVPHLKSDNPKVQKMLDEGRKRYVKKQSQIDELEKHRPKKSKGLAAPPKSKKPKKKKKSMGMA